MLNNVYGLEKINANPALTQEGLHIFKLHPKKEFDQYKLIELQRMAIKEGVKDHLQAAETLIKNSHGKPEIKGSQRHISISHCGHLVGFAFGTSPLGIDIHHQTEKVQRVLHKYLNAEELVFSEANPIIYHNLLWSAKEAVFKIFGTQIPFKNIQVQAFNLSEKEFLCVVKDRGRVRVTFEINADTFLCLAKPID